MNVLLQDDFLTLPMTKIASRYSSRKFPLHALTILSGHSKETTKNYYNSGKSKEMSSYAGWQYTLSGRGCIEVNNRCQDLLPGSLMVFSIPGPQTYYLPEFSSHWEFVFLTMIGREAVRIARMIEQRMGNIINTENLPLTISLFYEMLTKLFSGEINNPFSNSSYTYRLCMQFLEETGISRSEPQSEKFEELKNFLKSNMHRDIQVDDMAEVMHLSRSHFTRLFSKMMGMSPRMYLEDMRLKMAIDILFDKTATVKETAARCGIYDVNYFCRLFKKRYGISPGKYKERNFQAPLAD